MQRYADSRPIAARAAAEIWFASASKSNLCRLASLPEQRPGHSLGRGCGLRRFLVPHLIALAYTRHVCLYSVARSNKKRASMLNITFAINGRPVSADNIGDAIQAAMLAAVEEHVRSKLDGIRDPDTGEFPVVAVHGRDLENLSFTVSGSPKLVELVKSAFASSEPEESMTEPAEPRTPCAFICHSSKDAELARRVATDFRTQGIETFFAECDIGPGDSIRQKIDAGLEQCTHFVALLTPASINAPWVKTEMDAAFMRKVEGKCRFIALRHGLAVASLPPLLIGMYAPEIKDYDADVKGLIT